MTTGDNSRDNLRNGGQLLVDSLLANGTDMAFCVPGESYLTALDALHDAPSIDLVTCRQESGAAMMADAYGKLTGRPGICFVTRGPGATNASAGVHVAFQDSTPMILFVGQVGRGMRDREAFQEIDYRRMFGQMAKWVAEIDSAERVPEYVSHAYHTAMAGRPGPVVLSLPEDMLDDRAPAIPLNRAHRVQPAACPQAMAELRERLEKAERPLLVLGGKFWTDAGLADIKTFAEANHLPVACAFRYQDLFNNEHPNYVGDIGLGLNPALGERVKNADLLIAAGPRLGEMTTSGYDLLDIPMPKQDLVHVYPGAEELGRVYHPTLAINAGMDAFARAAAELEPVHGPSNPGWAEDTKQAHAGYLSWSEPTEVPGGVNVGRIVHMIRDAIPDDGIVTNGAGNFSGFLHRFFRHRDFGTQLAPTSGSMGYGVPAGIAAKRLYPARTVVTLAGDGDFMMTSQELATAAHHGINLIIVIVNNGMYGTIRMHQEKYFPGRVIATELSNPDFQLLAQAFGAHCERVEQTDDFPAAFERAQGCGKPAIIELVVDPEAITPTATLSGLRAAAEGA
jgi:acetolactate synthase I/II/III large subunit